MTREKFKKCLSQLIDMAESQLDHPDNPIDLRVARMMERFYEPSEVFLAYPPNYDDIWNYVKDAHEWYVDIYENFVGENCAEYMDISLCSWEYN